MRRYLLSLAILLSCILIGQAVVAQKDKGLVTYTLGRDTTTIQYFEFENGKFTTNILQLTGQVVRYEGVGELDEKGDIQEIKSKIFRLDSSGNWFLANEGINTFKNDSTIYTLYANGKVVNRRAIPAKGIVTNAADACSFFVFPYMGFFAPAKNGDTAFHCQLSFGECRTYHVSRKNKNELRVGSGVMGRLSVFVDNANKITGIDAVGSSVNFLAKVDRSRNDYANFIDAVGKRRNAASDFAGRTFRDTATLLIGDKKMEVDYWRPLRRDREIFGVVVPWNRIWRTGANNSTQLRTPIALTIDCKRLSAGKYSIWTYPTENGWQLIFNSKADVWGTEYDKGADVLSVPLTIEKVAKPVDLFTITLTNLGESKVLFQLSWDTYKASAVFIAE